MGGRLALLTGGGGAKFSHDASSSLLAKYGDQAGGGLAMVAAQNLRQRQEGYAMKMVDLSHMMNLHTPGWVGYAATKCTTPKIYRPRRS